MRPLWRILAGIGALLALVLVAIAVAIGTIDVRSFIGPVQQRVKDATGRELTVNGAVDLKLSLEPRLVARDVAMSNPAWAKAPQMVAAKRVEVEFALLPLLHRDFQVRSLALIEPRIALETDGKGVGNWVFGSGPPSAPGGAAADGAAATGGFFVGEFAISNGVLSYRDDESGKLTTVSIAELALKSRDPQSPVAASFRGSVDDTALFFDGTLGPLASLARQQWPYPISLKGQVKAQQVALDTKLRMQDGTTTLDPLALGVGSSRLTGQLSFTAGKPRPKLAFKLASPSLALAELAAPAKGAAEAAAPRAAPGSKFVFSEQPLDFSALRSVDAQGELTIDALTLPDGRRLDQVHVQMALQNGVLDAPAVQAGMFGGRVSARLKLDASRDWGATLHLRLDGSGLDLAAILAQAGVKREIKGGKTAVTAELSAHGASLHQWAASASGVATATVGQATLGHPAGNADPTFNKLAESINPFRKVDPSTELQCAVIRLPLAGGVARVDHSIGIETDKIGATASGTLDFRNETLDLSIRPQLRKGITLNIDQFASLVHFRGSFSAPSVGVDAQATAATVATLGAAVATGGTSLLGQALFKGATADTGAPCEIALGRAAPAAQQGASAPVADKPAPGNNELGRALGKLLGR